MGRRRAQDASRRLQDGDLGRLGRLLGCLGCALRVYWGRLLGVLGASWLWGLPWDRFGTIFRTFWERFGMVFRPTLLTCTCNVKATSTSSVQLRSFTIKIEWFLFGAFRPHANTGLTRPGPMAWRIIQNYCICKRGSNNYPAKT